MKKWEEEEATGLCLTLDPESEEEWLCDQDNKSRSFLPDDRDSLTESLSVFEGEHV